MKHDATVVEKARYIFTTGKIIHDRIIKIQSQCRACGEDGVCSELSMGQLHAIRIVRESGELTMSELAGRMAVSPPAASVMVDRLVEKGLLSRKHSTKDRRKVVVCITPEAVHKAEVIESKIMALFVELVDRIGPETTKKWCDVLEHVKSVLVDAPDSQPK